MPTFLSTYSTSSLVNTNHTYIHHLILLSTKSSLLRLRKEASIVIHHILSKSVLFDHDPDEIDLWLECIPRTVRVPNATAPDGTPLSDEAEDVISFLDSCLQLCLKSPYRYVDECFRVGRDTSDLPNEPQLWSTAIVSPQTVPSPWFMAVVDQLEDRTTNVSNLLAPSATVAIFTFIRILLVRLIGKQRDLSFSRGMSQRLFGILRSMEASYSPIIINACRWDCVLLAKVVQQLDPFDDGMKGIISSFDLQPSLVQLQQIGKHINFSIKMHFTEHITAICDDPKQSAHQLIDFMRFAGRLHIDQYRHVWIMVEHSCPQALGTLCEFIDPTEATLTNLMEGRTSLDNIFSR
jgi:hypothetical protein